MAILEFLRDRTNHAAAEVSEGPDRASLSDATSIQVPRTPYVLTAAERAECTCPEFCERDHGND